jgi:hypothetical protein
MLEAELEEIIELSQHRTINQLLASKAGRFPDHALTCRLFLFLILFPTPPSARVISSLFPSSLSLLVNLFISLQVTCPPFPFSGCLLRTAYASDLSSFIVCLI